MQLRHKVTQSLCSSSIFGVHYTQISVRYADDTLSDNLNNYDTLLMTGPRAGQWVSLADAFEQHDVITDIDRRRFAEPLTAGDRARGVYTITIQQLYDALLPSERNLPIEAETGWECGSNILVAAAVVEITCSVTNGEAVRPRCVILSSSSIAPEQPELDGGVIERVVITGVPE